MARYIDADETIELLKSLGSRDYRREKGTICDAIKMLQYPEYTPTADVAPKSEVAVEVIDEAIRAVYLKTDMKIYNTIEGKPLGDGVAFGKQQAMYEVISLLAELKKKYTEEKE